ncbi:MAG: NAD-dependent protein deacylase, partial [Thermicanus sp.]|nr:NAD-dependent protein deacylase [Thermicanus sp.]
METGDTLKRLKDWISASQKTVVLTGAGMSTESGVPDFRSKNGFYAHYDPAEVASVGAIENHYETFHQFYHRRIEDLKKVKPHKGHEILAQWEREGRIHLIATQNIDRLHQLAGNRNVYELH